MIKIGKKEKIAMGALFVGSLSLWYMSTTSAHIAYNAIGHATTTTASTIIQTPPVFVVTHVLTPQPTKGIYMTGWVGGVKRWRDTLIKLIDDTELNSIVIDIKDYSGGISFEVHDPILDKIGAQEDRIPDIKEFIGSLHKKGIYVIGRLSVFQDPKFVKARPDLAVKSKTTGGVWKDRKGLAWLDAGAKDTWDYIADLAVQSYEVGFDEINFDYIRFPSDGNMEDTDYTFASNKTKAEVIRNFSAYLFNYLHNSSLYKTGPGPVMSADLFGMTTVNHDDLGIGQYLENELPYFDYIDPMVYPSHYPATFIGFKNPAEHPYDIVRYSMTTAVERANAASATPNKLRPWIQDFNLGAVYTPEMVKAQIKATYDSGLTSWLVWDASNKYTATAELLRALREKNTTTEIETAATTTPAI